MVFVDETPAGVILAVKAHPRARRDGVTGVHDGELKVDVSQAPEMGKANSAIIKILANSLGLKKNQFELQVGQTSAHKKFLLRGITKNELLAKITALLNKRESDLSQ